MESVPALLLGTVVLRPYVFIFLLVYLIGCSLHLGLKRALIFCAAGYALTWLSEYSSIHTGFPYGWYRYIDSTSARELWVLGVPFMDSLSYVFLAYASYSLALLVLCPAIGHRGMWYMLETRETRGSLAARILGALFMVYLDIIIDPVALQGEKWFLGRLYEYPGGGVYFGIPVSNFAGWALVGFLLVWLIQWIDTRLEGKKDVVGYGYPSRYLIGPGLYLGIAGFNIFMAFFIGEYNTAWSSLFIFLLPAVLVFSIVKMRLAGPEDAGAIDAHRRDFPDARVPVSARQ
ncbi:MAG: carotenoid biosynthesis protein [Nitrospiraceae bacterium]|nr:carotenoid biosynthesis protein [Nitrospiraceae bacterium]